MQSNFTMEDLQNLGNLLLPQIKGIVRDELKPIHKKIDKVITILDGHTAILERHDHELLILGAQQQKTTEVLVRKGITISEELAIS